MSLWPKRCAQLSGVATACFMVAWTSTAAAQDADHLVLGAGVLARPDYQGSDHYRVQALPVIDVRKGRVFANLANGVGVTLVETDNVTVGVSAMYMPGYRRRDVPSGIDKLSLGVGPRVFASVQGGGVIAALGVVKGVSGGTKGVLADASLSYPMQLSPRVSLTPNLGATWSDSKHNDRYFGVNAAEAQASGLPAFSAGAGFKDVFASVTLAYRLTDRIALSATAGGTTLVGDIKDSPLVRETTQVTGVLAAAYRF